MSFNIFKNTSSIRKKLLVITLSVTFVALFFFALAQVVIGFYYSLEMLEKNLSISAKTTGFQSTASLEFLDYYSAVEVLSALKQNESVVKGCLYNDNMDLFVSYMNGGSACEQALPSSDNKEKTIFDLYTFVIEPVLLKGNVIGYIYLESSLEPISEYFVQFMLYIVIILIGSTLIAYQLVRHFQRYISGPVQQLRDVIREVSNTNNYDLRAEKISKDEVGDLVVGFNNMLRLIQIHNENLEKEKKNAENANSAKTEFLSNMSHEIRTPLNGIIGTAELLSRAKLNEEEKKYIQIITQSGKSLLAIINDVLDISKIEAGQIQLDPIECDLREIMTSVVAAFSAVAISKGVSLYASIPTGMPFLVMVDETRMRQVLTNLVSNAIKFTSSGEVSIKVHYNVLGDQTCHYVIDVTDTGIGIEKEKLKEIFNRFTQEDGSITRMYGGTGLGLSICEELVRLMGGEISIKSVKGQGSTFSFKVTLETVEEKSKLIKEAEPSENEKLKVLVAEDDQINQKIIKKMIESLGHEVYLASNGQLAVDAYRENDYDLVLMDMQMPVMDGIDATKEIRTFEHEFKKPEKPILALTANALEQHKDMCFEAGMTGYFTKPITMQSIEEMLSYKIK